MCADRSREMGDVGHIIAIMHKCGNGGLGHVSHWHGAAAKLVASLPRSLSRLRLLCWELDLAADQESLLAESPQRAIIFVLSALF